MHRVHVGGGRRREGPGDFRGRARRREPPRGREAVRAPGRLLRGGADRHQALHEEGRHHVDAGGEGACGVGRCMGAGLLKFFVHIY